MTTHVKIPTTLEAAEAVRTLLRYLGEDPDRSGLKDTPQRVLQAWMQDWGTGYQTMPAITMFEEQLHGSPDPMVLVRGMRFFSHCEHHLAPFFGTADVAYIPANGRIAGLSKLSRIVNHFSRRLQVQERLTYQIAEEIVDGTIGSPDVAVMLRATHTCMLTRGVREAEATTTTTALRGKFNEASVRAEFLQHCYGSAR